MKKEKCTKLSTLQSDAGGHMMLLAPVTITKVLQFHSVFSLVLNAKTKKQKNKNRISTSAKNQTSLQNKVC